MAFGLGKTASTYGTLYNCTLSVALLSCTLFAKLEFYPFPPLGQAVVPQYSSSTLYVFTVQLVLCVCVIYWCTCTYTHKLILDSCLKVSFIL